MEKISVVRIENVDNSTERLALKMDEKDIGYCTFCVPDGGEAMMPSVEIFLDAEYNMSEVKRLLVDSLKDYARNRGYEEFVILNEGYEPEKLSPEITGMGTAIRDERAAVNYDEASQSMIEKVVSIGSLVCFVISTIGARSFETPFGMREGDASVMYATIYMIGLVLMIATRIKWPKNKIGELSMAAYIISAVLVLVVLMFVLVTCHGIIQDLQRCS